MKESLTHPARSLQTVAVLVRWMVRCTLAALLLIVGVWALVHIWLVPRASDYRDWLAQKASETTGLEIQIRHVDAWRVGWLPTVALEGIEVAAAGQETRSVTVERIIVALTPQSLWSGALAQLVIESPEAEVRRMSDGRWSIGGIVLPSGETSSRSPVADWLFAQPEVVVRRGTLHWLDERQAQSPPLPPLRHTVTDVDLLLRNTTWRHEVQLSAQLPAGWGDDLKVVGRFREPVFSTDPKRWIGQWFVQLPQVNLARVQQTLAVSEMVLTEGMLLSGYGGLRVWGDMDQGRIQKLTADVALHNVHMQGGDAFGVLNWHRLSGRLQGSWSGADVLEVQVQKLHIQARASDAPVTQEAHLRYAMAPGRDHGRLTFSALDLGVWSQWAKSFPIPDSARQALQDYQPRGAVKNVEWQWTGPWQQPHTYQLTAQLKDFGLGPQGKQQFVQWGVQGLSGRLEATHTGGQAHMQIEQGHVVLPGVFEEPRVPVDRLETEVSWRLQGDAISVELPNLRFANADAAGSAQVRWRTAENTKEDLSSRFPGVLDLQGNLQRANGAKVHRYLPLAIPDEARHYVRDAIVSGVADQTTFQVQGDLQHLPFDRPGTGVFRIAANVRDVVYAYVPTHYQDPGQKPWPRLMGLRGKLIFEGAGMQVRDASGKMEFAPSVHLQNVQANIPDLENTVVEIDAQAHGSLGGLLGYLRNSPVDAMTDHALTQAEGVGNARLDLQLELPIDQLENTQVRGEVHLTDNQLRLVPRMPWLSKAQGSVRFSEQGFTLQNIQAEGLGGAVRAEGGMQGGLDSTGEPGTGLRVQVQGEATAQGLRDAQSFDMISELGQRAQGRTRYTLLLEGRNGQPYWEVRTDLQGMSMQLPYPLGKAAQDTWPVRYAQWTQGTGSTPHEYMHITVDQRLDAQLAWQTEQDDWRLHRASVQVGDGMSPLPTQKLPEQGVHAALSLPTLDVDAWLALATTSTLADASPLSKEGDAWLAYAPTQYRMQIEELQVLGQKLHSVVVHGDRSDKRWRSQIRARELEGQVLFDQTEGASGAIHARLQRVTLSEAEGAPKEVKPPVQQVRTLPALDVMVDRFEMRGRSLGRLIVKATNEQSTQGISTWDMERLQLEMPEATLNVKGQWSQQVAGKRHTQLDFTWDITDTGQLLQRLGYPDVVRQGRGRLQGQVGWEGSPVQLDKGSLQGHLNVLVEKGQFLKADPGMAKLLGVLSLQALPRRLQLDFRDVFSEGFAFDRVQGDVRIAQGVAHTNTMEMRGVNAAVFMEGEANIVQETQQLQVVVVPEINAMGASLLATAINPVVGVGSLLAQWALRGPLTEAATQAFQIYGTWKDPQVQRLSAVEALQATPKEPADSNLPNPSLPADSNVLPDTGFLP